MESSVEEKQSYLRKHIMDSNYDPEEFAEFCERELGNIDIQGWTFDQLRKIVSQFVNSKQEEQENHNFKSEGSSFTMYQQQAQEMEEIDVDNIDVNQQTPQVNMYDPNSSTRGSFSKQPQEPQTNINDMFTNAFSMASHSPSKTNNEQGWASNMWSIPSQPVTQLNGNNFNFQSVGLMPQVQHQMKVQVPLQATKDDFDIFSDFSTPLPTNKPQESKPNTGKPICKPPTTFKPPAPKNIPAPTPKINVAPPKAIQKPSIKPQTSAQNFSIFDLVLDTIPVPLPLQKPTSDIPSLAASMSQSLYIPQSIPKHTADSDTAGIRLKSTNEGPRVVKEDFFDNIPCIKAKVRSVLAEPSITVEVTGHEIASRSFVLPSYVLYTIVTKPLNVEVKRKYTYFEKLRHVLSKFYPGIRMPYLERAAWLSETNVDLISNQKQVIKRFMNDLLLNRQLRNCRIVEQFLTIKDKNTLKNKFIEYEKMDPLKSIEEMCLLRGSVDVAYTDQHRIYFERLGNFLGDIESGIDKYKGLAEKLSGHYTALTKTYTEIQEVFAVMESSTKFFNSHINFCECYDLERSLKALNDYYRELNATLEMESKLLDKEFKRFWNYEGNNINTLKDLLDVRTKMTDTYNKSFSDNSSRNNQYLNNKAVDSSKTGVTEISKHPAVLKYQMGFFNQASSEQTMRLFNDLSHKINEKLVWGAAQLHEGRLKQLTEFYRAQKRITRN